MIPQLRDAGFVDYCIPEAHRLSECEGTLYHYCSLTHGKSNLQAERIKLTNPVNFNDPFDSVGYYKGYPTEAAFEKYFMEFFSHEVKEICDCGGTIREAWLECRDIIPKVFSRLMLRKASFVGNLIGCFCGNAKAESDVLLWSHYADNCRGIRVGYSIPRDAGYSICAVKYASRMPRLDFHKLTSLGAETDEFAKMLHEFHVDMLLTKYRAWSYEAEYRLITHKNDCGLVRRENDLWFAMIPWRYVVSVDFGYLAFGYDKFKAWKCFLDEAQLLNKETGLPLKIFRLACAPIGRYGYEYWPYEKVRRRFAAHQSRRKDL